MAEGTEEVVPPIEPELPLPETVVAPPELPAESDPDKEPGGDSPEAVFARKQYREAKTAKLEAQQSREAVIRLEEQLRLAKEAPVKPAEKIYTPDEVETAIEAGQIKRSEGMAYLARVEATKVIRESEAQKEAAQPIVRAAAKVEEYRKLGVTWMDNPADPKYIRATQIYQQRVRDGYPNDLRSTVDAIREVEGDLDMLKQRKESAAMTRANNAGHAETSAGGGSSAGTTGKVDLSKATPTMKAAWDRDNVPEKSRVREMGYYLQLKARRQA